MAKFTRKKQTNSNKQIQSQKKQSYIKILKSLLPKNAKKANINGRPTRLTPETQKTILDAIELGMPIEAACQLIRVTELTYYHWMQWGKKEHLRITDLLKEVTKILQEKKYLDINNVDQMSQFLDEFIKLQPDNIYYSFYILIQESRAKSHQIALSAIQKAQVGGEYRTEQIEEKNKSGKVTKTIERKKYLKPDWNAAAWFLEKKYNNIYGKNVVGSDESQTSEDLAREIHEAIQQMDESVSTE